ncbi:MAG: hypothetical protein IT515_00160 [Burkholderiales bacterium]|nr:hypothetical protein [Burkholderiales bacterium]
MLRALLVLLACVAAAPVAAQVYSWRDPHTGQLRISTVPPPWLRERGAAAGGPRVHVFMEGKVVPPERIGAGGKVLEPESQAGPPAERAGAPGTGTEEGSIGAPELVARRNALQSRLVADALHVGPASANAAFFKRLDEYFVVSEQADAADPAGARMRAADREFGMQQIKANIERVLVDPAQRADFQGEATRWLSKRSDLTAQRIVRCLRDGFC